MIMPMSMAVRVRIRRVSQATPTTPRMMNKALKLSSTCCGIIGPRGVCSTTIRVQAARAATPGFGPSRALSTQSAMKLGCRSQSWNIISQKQDMMAIQQSSRGSTMFTSVRQSTWRTDSVFDAPEGTSRNVSSSSRLNEVNTAEARNRLRQASWRMWPRRERMPGSRALEAEQQRGQDNGRRTPRH